LLGRGVSEQQSDLDRLGQLLDPQIPETLQKAALAALRGLADSGVPEVLLGHWKSASPARRQEILNILLSRAAWLEAVVGALENGRLSPGEIGAAPREKLLHHSAPEVERRATKLFSEINADRMKIVRAYKNVLDLAGNPDRGHQLFSQNCSICHQFRGEGNSIGPDLGTVADKPVQELVVAILDPNQAVDPAYTSYTVTTKDDRELSGILIAETPNSISLRLPGGAEEVILRSNVKEVTSAGRSLMPEGFETGLRPQDLADVIAYILSRPAGR
jgi:putative heme-binding domain-containing protein